MEDTLAEFKKKHLGILLKRTPPSEASANRCRGFDHFSQFPV